jgi:VWFA-related protein
MLDVTNLVARPYSKYPFSSDVVGKVACTAIFCLLTALFAVAQTPDAVEEDTESLRIGTDLVQTDVMVFDRQGKFVEGLRPEQFELRVDGRVQAISFFEQVKAGNPDEERKVGGGRRREQLREPTIAAATLGGRVIFFFLDDLHLQLDSLNRTRDAILRFVDNDMQLNDRVAIFTASGQLGVLQQLTSEKAVLRAALKKLSLRSVSVSGGAERTPMSEAQALAVENNDRALIDYFVKELSKERNEPIPDRRRTLQRSRTNQREGSLESMVAARARSVLEQSRQITRNTLQTLENLVRASTPIMSRKILFFISDGFLVTTNSDAPQQIKQITDSAARSGVVIYSLEARGLTSGLQDASGRGNFDVSGTITALDTKAVSATQEPLRTIARETGGAALLDSNKFTDIFRQAVNETSDYYILAWQPDEESQKNVNFRTIEASIKGRDDLIVRLTRGYFNETTETVSKNKREKPKKKPPLLEALHALYPRRALPVFVTAGFVNSAPTGLTLTTSVQVDSRALGVEKAEKTEIEIVGVLINEDGKEVSNFNQNLTIDPSKMSKAQQRNIFFTHQMPVKPGIYQIRVAVQDNKTKRVGSNFYWIEVPDPKQAGFAVGSLFVGEVEADSNQPVINVSRRMLKSSRFFFQTEIYNAAMPVNVGIELQIFRAGQLIKTLPVRKASTDGVVNLSNLPYLDDFSLAALEPGIYVLQINVSDRTANKTASRQIDFFVE